MAGPVMLKKLLRDRHWQVYRTFCTQYDKAALGVDRGLVGTYPSRAQLHRWLSGDLKSLPHPHHCQVLEAMLPGMRAVEMFEPLTRSEPSAETTTVPDGPDLVALIAAGLNAPTDRLDGWADRLSPASAQFGRSAHAVDLVGPEGGTAARLARAVVLLGRRLRLTDAEVGELAKLAGHLVDLELECTIDIGGDGLSEVAYRFQVANLTDQPVRRMGRELWFENTDGRLRIEPHPSSDREVHIQRVHDTANMSKFACVFAPAIEPGEVGTIAYLGRGGHFLHDHYWRQSVPRYTRRMTLTVRHHHVDMLVNCIAIIDCDDGSQRSAIDDLVCTYEDEAAVISVTQDYLRPNDAVTVRWEVARGAA